LLYNFDIDSRPIVANATALPRCVESWIGDSTGPKPVNSAVLPPRFFPIFQAYFRNDLQGTQKHKFHSMLNSSNELIFLLIENEFVFKSQSNGEAKVLAFGVEPRQFELKV
jgi:hypothetical protein